MSADRVPKADTLRSRKEYKKNLSLKKKRKVQRAHAHLRPKLSEEGKVSLDFLTHMIGRNAVYIFSKSRDAELVKIGLAKDFDHRLSSYLLYMPEGVFVHDVFITKTPRDSQVLEYSIHAYLGIKNRFVVGEHTHLDEWYNLSRHEVQTLTATILANRNTKYSKCHQLKEDRIKGTHAARVCKGTKVFPFQEHVHVDHNVSVSITKRVEHLDATRVLAMTDSLKKKIENNYKKKKKKESFLSPVKKTSKKYVLESGVKTFRV
jgi:hypothetical protein